jgi:hypothetical protein
MQRQSRTGFSLDYCATFAKTIMGECAQCHSKLEKSRTLLVMSSDDRPIHYKVLCCETCAVAYLGETPRRYKCANYCGADITTPEGEEGEEERKLFYFSRTVTTSANRGDEDQSQYTVNVFVVFCSAECQEVFERRLSSRGSNSEQRVNRPSQPRPPSNRGARERRPHPDADGWTNVGRK